MGMCVDNEDWCDLWEHCPDGSDEKPGCESGKIVFGTLLLVVGVVVVLLLLLLLLLLVIEGEISQLPRRALPAACAELPVESRRVLTDSQALVPNISRDQILVYSAFTFAVFH